MPPTVHPYSMPPTVHPPSTHTPCHPPSTHTQAAVAAMSDSAKALQAGLEAHFQPNAPDEPLPPQVRLGSAWKCPLHFAPSFSLLTPPPPPPLPCHSSLPPLQAIDNVPVFRGDDALRADGTGTFPPFLPSPHVPFLPSASLTLCPLIPSTLSFALVFFSPPPPPIP